MGKGSPTPPDFSKLAADQTTQNRPNQSNPYGSTTWGTGPDGRPTQTTAFTGALAPGANAIEDQASKAWASPLDNGQQARTDATNAVYGQEASRLDPQWKQAGDANNASLAAQGLDPTSQAGQAQTDTFNRAKNDAYSSAQNQAITQGGNAAQQQQQLDLNSRNAPLSALSSLKNLLSMSSFGQAGDLLSAGQDQFGDNMQQYNANGGALGGFGSLMTALGPLVQGGMKAYAGGM
jgi:hypothetical protein